MPPSYYIHMMDKGAVIGKTPCSQRVVGLRKQGAVESVIFTVYENVPFIYVGT